jgi:DNA-binding protein H-NS
MKEKAAVISRIHTLMEFWGITPEDLEADLEVKHRVARKKQQQSAEPAAAATAPKYAHPKTGQVWDGEGPQPQWLKDAVLKEGYLVEELRQAALERAEVDQAEENSP